MDLTTICERLRFVVGPASYRQIGEVTDTHPETVRRYMLGQSPSVEFIAAVCQQYQINSEWLLSGQGPARRADVKPYALRLASPAELLAALATAMERTNERADQLERTVHNLESRLRAAGHSAGSAVNQQDPLLNGEAGTLGTAPANSPKAEVHPGALRPVVRSRGTGAAAEGTAPGLDGGT